MKKFFLLNMLLLFSQHCNASYEDEINKLLTLDPKDYPSAEISSDLQREMINFKFLKKIKDLFKNPKFNDLRTALIWKSTYTNLADQDKVELILNQLLPAINNQELTPIDLAREINSIKEQLKLSAEDQKSFDSFIQSLPIPQETKERVKTGEKAANQPAAERVNKTSVKIEAASIFEPEIPANPQYPKAQGNKESEINDLIINDLILSLNKNKQTKESFVNALADKLIDIIGLTDPTIKDNLKTQLVRDLTPSTTIGNIKQKLGNVSENDRYLRRVNLTILDLLNPQSKKYGKFTKGITSYRVENTQNRTDLYLNLEKAITTARTSLTDQTIVPSKKQQSAQLDAIVNAKHEEAARQEAARQEAAQKEEAARAAEKARISETAQKEEAAKQGRERRA